MRRVRTEDKFEIVRLARDVTVVCFKHVFVTSSSALLLLYMHLRLCSRARPPPSGPVDVANLHEDPHDDVRANQAPVGGAAWRPRA